MAKIHLRDVCDRLSSAGDVESIIDALLAYLRAYQGDWHPTLALVDGQRDAITRIWQRERGRLDRRDVVIPVDQLPARLVRKFFRPSAFFNASERRSLLTKVFRATPVYEPDKFESAQVQPLVAPVPWHSCIVLPLADQDDLLALLVVVSPRKGAFPAAAVEQVLAMRTMAALAMARRLQAAGRQTPETRQAEEQSRRVQGMFQERLRQLESESTALAQENRLKSERMELLAREVERIQHAAHFERAELEQLRQKVRSLDEQGTTTAQHLNDAYSQLAAAQQRLNEQHETMEFLRQVFAEWQGEHDDSALSRRLVQRFCEAFAVGRCTLMRVDETHLRIAAQRGLDPTIAGRVKLPLGQGVAGWVAHHRKPLLIRNPNDASPVRATKLDRYNSDSFVSVPLVHRNRLLGVLNLSNKADGRTFDETDLERAIMVSGVLSVAMGVRESASAASRANGSANGGANGSSNGATNGSTNGGASRPEPVLSLVVSPGSGVPTPQPSAATGAPESLEQRELPPFEMRG